MLLLSRNLVYDLLVSRIYSHSLYLIPSYPPLIWRRRGKSDLEFPTLEVYHIFGIPKGNTGVHLVGPCPLFRYDSSG